MQRPAEEWRAPAPPREIYRGRRFVVTRASGSQRRSVVEKTVEPGREHPAHPATVEALLHEAAVLKRVEAPGVEKVVALRTVRAVPVLVVEDAGPVTLRERTRRPFEVGAFLDVAVRLAEIVAHVHACDVIHRDINPSNVVLGAGDVPTLIDFDRAATGASVACASNPLDELGTALEYASPEQLGRTNRVVDGRSDLYSLGTVFYEMLTGAPPFRSDDPLEIVHAHLARTPVSPTVIAAGVPHLLSRLVLKLLSKMPEARYQTAAALAADLREARERWQTARSIAPFELGSLDLALELPLPEKLYGREPELAALRAAVDRVAAGPREMVLVAGDAGVGKSALVMALRDEVARRPSPAGPAASSAPPAVRFISGKFDLRAANAPFASLIEALRGLLAALDEESEGQREACRARILEAVGVNGRVLTELLPELEDLIGASPALAPLEPLEAQTRLHVTLQAFVQVFAAPERPLVIFLDDLQWADTASLEVLRALATDPEGKHMLLVGAFRPRDAGPGHPLSRLDADLKRAGVPAARVDLAPLTEPSVRELLSDALHAAPASVAPLAELLAHKTAGNPFFLRQILGTLHRTGLLAFDPRDRRWSWRLGPIDRVGITANVVELLLEAIRQLPAETRTLLPLAACLGRVACLDVLVGISGQSEAEIRAALEPAFREGLLVAENAPGKCRFAHDRVQQAAYSLLSEPRRMELHLRIGRFLRTEAKAEDPLFEATDHMNLGSALLATAGERFDLARQNHRAGLKAKAAAAFGPALAYMRAGLAILPAEAWETDVDLAMLLQREAAECAYLTGDYALSDELVEAGLVRATSPALRVHRLELHNLRIVSETARAAWQRALDHGRRALSELGYALPSPHGGDIEAAVAEEERAVDALLQGRPPQALLAVPLMTDPADLAVLRLLVNLAHPAWWFRDRGLFRLLTFRTLRFILERGHGPESLTAICDVAMCLSSQDRFDAADAYGRVAQDLAWRLGHPGQQAHAQFLYAAFVERWRQPYSVVYARLRRALESAKRVGEMRSAAYALSAAVIFAFAASRELDDFLRDLEDDMPFLRKTHNEGVIAFHLCYRQSARCLKGLTSGRNRFDEPGFDEEAFLRAAEGVPSLVCLYWIRRLHTSFIFRDFVEAHGYAEASSQLMESMAGFVPAIDYLPYSSLCLAALCETGPAGKRAEWLARIADNQRRLARWAQSCPANFRHLYVMVEAEVARIERRLPEAADLYDEAIEAASEGGFVHDAAVASELAGRHALARGRMQLATLYLRKARERYARWGAAEKVRALEEEFPEMGRSESPSRGGRIRDGDLDILSLLKSAETISTEVVLDRLLERLVAVCAEAAGAERVVVVLEEDGEPFVRAVGTAAGRVALERTALPDAAPLARLAIEQARLTRRPLVVDEAVHDPRVAADPCVTSRAMKSILALPVQRQGGLVATLYFENNLVTHAFTPARLRVLELLSAQIAAALENSLLFERLRREVSDNARLVQRAQDAVRAREEFLSVAAHELHTPITSLHLMIQALQRGGVPVTPETVRQTFAVADRQVRRLIKLIDELLDVSRIEAHTLPIDCERVDLAMLVQDVAERFGDDARRAGSEVSFAAEGPAVGSWDPARLDQVVSNLLSNAIKFGAARPIDLAVLCAGGEARLVVRDHGIGVAAERLPHIFERFERGVSSRQYGGLGLGLYIVRSIVESLGGQVRWEETPGGGSTFHVSLPCRPAGPAAREAREAGGDPQDDPACGHAGPAGQGGA